MTAVDVDALDKLREALAPYGLTDDVFRYGPDGLSRSALDALLPVVDRIASERAAAELRAAAEAWEKHGNSWRQMLAGNSAPFAYARWVRTRADALDPT